MMSMLQRELAIPANRMLVVVNRYTKNAPVMLADVEESLQVSAPVLIPNDYKNVSACINYGRSLHDYAPKAAITHAVRELGVGLIGDAETKEPGLIKRALGNFFGSQHA
jgi:pilus assembly protein CpaE